MKPTVKITAVFSTVICVLVLGALSQIPTYQQRYRPDCEHKQCREPVTNHDKCPPWGSCQWYCQEKLANCTFGTRYHCARDLHNKEQFTHACAAELFCLIGEEPQISVQGPTGKASVYCRPCYKTDKYNSRLNTSSATFSECNMLKKNLCKKEDNKIDCGNETYTELTKTDGYCRCDARRGYAARSREMCFYENEVCIVKTCPDGMELLLNYTCGLLCPTGFARQSDSDICKDVSLKPSHLFTTDIPEDKVTSTTTRTFDNQSTNEQFDKEIIIPMCVLVAVFVFVAVIIKKKLNKKGKRQKRQDRSSGIELTPMLNTHGTLAHGSASIAEDPQISSPICEHTESQPNFYKKEECEEVFKLVILQDYSQWKSFLQTIDTKIDHNIEYFKETKLMEPKPSNFQIIDTVHIPGYSAFKESGGVKNTCLFEWASHRIAGNRTMAYVLRVASARHAIVYFETYVDKLTEAFEQSGNRHEDTQLFFAMHGIECQEATKDCIRLAYVKLVHKTLTVELRKDMGPFLAEFLCCVLNCKIVHHFEDNLYFKRSVATIPGMGVTLTAGAPEDREMHFYWMKPDVTQSHTYRLVPLCECPARETSSQYNMAPSSTSQSKGGQPGKEPQCPDVRSDEGDQGTGGRPGKESQRTDGQPKQDLQGTGGQPKTETQCTGGKTENDPRGTGRPIKSPDVKSDKESQRKSGKPEDIVKGVDVHIEKPHGLGGQPEMVHTCVDVQLDKGHHIKVKGASHALDFDSTHFAAIEPSKLKSSETMNLLEDLNTPEPSSTSADSTHVKSECYPGYQTIDNVLRYITEKGRLKKKECLKIIGNDTDLHKLDGFDMGLNDPYFTEVCTRIDVPGYQAYEIPGYDTASLYELVSVLLCGHTNIKDIIRLAVARSALINYTHNVKKLYDMFVKATNAAQEAKTFFNAHGIEYKETVITRDVVELCYLEFVTEIIIEGKCKGPFHVQLLGSVLNCNIIQHFEDGTFYDQDVKRLPWVNIGLHSCKAIDREMRFYWLRSNRYDSSQCMIMPLFKHDNQYFSMDSERYTNSTFQKQCEAVIKRISQQRPLNWTSFLQIIKEGVRYDFESLKTAHMCKLKGSITKSTAIVPGFTAFDRPRNKPVCLYEWISHMFCGTEFMKFVVRLAATRFAMENFKKYSKKLCEAFEKSDEPLSDAEMYFKLHGITFHSSKDLKNDVKIALAALVRETFTDGRGNGPLHADFVCGALLNRKLTLHFVNYQDVGTIPALNVTLSSVATSGKEVHLLWRESRSDQPDTCRILRLIKDKDPNGESETMV